MEERHATWTELFYDLIFVVAVAVLGEALVHDPSWRGVLTCAALFVPVWWSWVGYTTYADRFDSDDVFHRLLTALQMLAIAAMALFLGRGVAGHSEGFALSYVCFRVILIGINLRVYQYVPPARPLVLRFVAGYAFESALWLASLLLEPPGRYVFWGIGTATSMLVPLVTRRQQARARLDPRHLAERYGLFTLIVLGEAVAEVVAGAVDGETMASSALLAAAFAFLAAFSFWWIYYGTVNDRALNRYTNGPDGTDERRSWASLGWTYIHLPLAGSLTAFGVGVELLIATAPGSPVHDGERWLLCGAAAVALLGLSVIHLDAEGRLARWQATAHAAGAVLLIALAVLGGELRPLALAMLVALLCALQVVADMALDWRGRATGSSSPVASTPAATPTA